jgi:hypothetical protein
VFKKIIRFTKKLIVKPVKRAVKIFSPQVTTALSYLEKYKNPDFLESQPRIELMEFMYTFFKIHDVSDFKIHDVSDFKIHYVSDKTQYFRKQEPISVPYHLTWLAETLLSYINTLQELSKQNKMKGLTKKNTKH